MTKMKHIAVFFISIMLLWGCGCKSEAEKWTEVIEYFEKNTNGQIDVSVEISKWSQKIIVIFHDIEVANESEKEQEKEQEKEKTEEERKMYDKLHAKYGNKLIGL